MSSNDPLPLPTQFEQSAPTTILPSAPDTRPPDPAASTTAVRGLPTNGPPRYELTRELGRGGMGVVYEARDRDLNRTVAVKMILYAGWAGSSVADRFLKESEALAAVQHSN